MSLTAARSLQDLRPLIFGNHPLELHQQMIFRAVTLRRFTNSCLDSVASEFFDQQNLVGVLPAETVGCVRQYNLDLPFGR
jgi:hypothetical protein